MNKVLTSCVVLFLFTGCTMVGPDYKAAEFPDTDILSLLEEGEGGVITRESLSVWWQELNDPILVDLIDAALAGNQSLDSARSVLRQSRWTLGIAQAGLFPRLDTSGIYNRSRVSKNGPSYMAGDPKSNYYDAGFDASWEIDVFGGTRRKVEAAEASLQAQEESLKSTWVSLAGEVAGSYVQLRTLQKRLEVAQSNLTLQSETLELLESRYAAGLSDNLAICQMKYNLEQTRSQIPSIRTSIEGTLNTLAVLTGKMPGNLHETLSKPTPIPVPALTRLVGVPANALRQRPDIRAAERRLAAQTARIGEATANLYPKFYLNGSIGLESLSSSDFLEANSRTWNFGPAVSWPVFNAGSIRANIQIQNELQTQASLQYETIVLNAVKEFRDTLVGFVQEQERRDALLKAVESAAMAVSLAQDQYQNGLVDFSNVIDAQRSLLSLQDQLADSEGTITQNIIRLYKALGGGWQSLEQDISSLK